MKNTTNSLYIEIGSEEQEKRGSGMILELKRGSRRMHGGNSTSRNSRKRNQRMLLLLLALALAAAALSAVLLHELREGRIHGLLVQDRDQEPIPLMLILKRERKKTIEMTKKLEDRRLKIFALRTQRTELIERLTESQAMVDRLQKIQKEMETILAEKQNQINRRSEKTEETSISRNFQVTALTELVKQREAEIEEAKGRLMKLSPTEIDTTKGDDKQQEGTPREGKWMKSKSGMDHEGLIAGGKVREDQQKQNVTNSSENETSEEGGKMSQANASKNKEQIEDLKNEEVRTSGKWRIQKRVRH